MGCGTSRVKDISMRSIKETKGTMMLEQTGLTAKQKKLLQKSWKYLSGTGSIMGRGSRVFLRIFELKPEVKQLFRFGQLTGDDLQMDPSFRSHATRFMQALGAVMDDVDSFEAKLTETLVGLGRNHISIKNFNPHYFNAFEEGILHIWSEDLGNRFTPECREAWITVLKFLQNELIRGYQLAWKETVKKEQIK